MARLIFFEPVNNITVGVLINKNTFKGGHIRKGALIESRVLNPIITVFALYIYGVIVTSAFIFINESQADNLILLLIRHRNRKVHEKFLNCFQLNLLCSLSLPVW